MLPGAASTGAGAQREAIDTISKACAYGAFDKLRQFVEADASCVNKPDENGYFPLQWAALNNRVPETTFLLRQGANPNAADQTGQTALHWAAVRGSLPVIETLLRHNADPEARDNRGYTLVHVAAQYGQTSVIYHLALKWNVDIDSQDNDGRTPLHWAAYKGFTDTIRLLLVLDARYTLADKEGCTALHWAAIKGNGEACTVLLQGGSWCVLTHKDVTGCTPAQLALDKGHRYLGMHLAEYRGKNDSGGMFGKNGKFGWVTATQLCPVIWAMVLSLVGIFVYKVMDTPGAPMGQALKLGAWSVVISVSITLFFLYKTTTADPGFVPTGWELHSKSRSAGSGGGSSGADKGANGGSTSPDSSSHSHSHHHHHSTSTSSAHAVHPSASTARLLKGGGGGSALSDIENGVVGISGGGGVGSLSSGSAAGGGIGKAGLLDDGSIGGGGDSGGNGAGGGRGVLAASSHLKHLDSPALWAGNWQQLCVSCRIVRPLRAKHCSVTDRCIEVFDHYCPWVGNAIGKGNRHFFLTFLCLALYSVIISATVALVQLQRHMNSDAWRAGHLLWMVAFMVLDIFIGISVAALGIAQASQVARNVTTNELANWHRYKYLQGPDGRSFHNPFSRGCRQNCVDTCFPERVPTAPVYLPRETIMLQDSAYHHHHHGPGCRDCHS